MIPWKDPLKQIPEEGRQVVCFSWHWKNRFPGSMEIMGGEVQYPNKEYRAYTKWACQTNDESGGGSFQLTANTHDSEIDAWCYAEEFRAVLPDWIKPEGA